MHFCNILHLKALRTKFALAIKFRYVKVNTGSSLIQFPKNKIPRYYIPSFKTISQVVLEKRTFKVFTLYGLGGHLGHVTGTKYINFPSAFAWKLYTKFNNCPNNFRGEVRSPLKNVDIKLTSNTTATEMHFFNTFHLKALRTKFDLAIK